MVPVCALSLFERRASMFGSTLKFHLHHHAPVCSARRAACGSPEPPPASSCVREGCSASLPRRLGAMRSRAMDRTALQTLVRVQGRPCRRPVRLLGRACSASCDAHAHACVHAHGSADDAASARQHAWTLCAAAALLFRRCAHAVHHCACSARAEHAHARACMHAHRSADDTASARQYAWPLPRSSAAPPSRPPGHPRAAAQLLSRGTLESSSLREETWDVLV